MMKLVCEQSCINPSIWLVGIHHRQAITVNMLEAARILRFPNQQQRELYVGCRVWACIVGDTFLLCLVSISRLLEVGSQGSFREEFVVQASLVTVKNLRFPPSSAWTIRTSAFLVLRPPPASSPLQYASLPSRSFSACTTAAKTWVSWCPWW